MLLDRHFFAGVTSILAKSGIKKTDSNVATAIRTIVVFIFSWIMVFVVGSQASIKMVGQKTLLFFNFVRAGDRSIMVMLFPCIADRRY